MDHVSDLMQLSKVTSTRTYTRNCYGRFMQPGPEPLYIFSRKAESSVTVRFCNNYELECGPWYMHKSEPAEYKKKIAV